MASYRSRRWLGTEKRLLLKKKPLLLLQSRLLELLKFSDSVFSLLSGLNYPSTCCLYLKFMEKEDIESIIDEKTVPERPQAHDAIKDELLPLPKWPLPAFDLEPLNTILKFFSQPVTENNFLSC